ncbi:MAG: hypothetical protein IPN92_04575 [Chromatiaceae bacterium]|nr:hypothetical protein [Chromatiaceae bacterium]
MSSSPTPADSRRYLWYLGLTAFGLLASLVTLTYWVDPYVIHQWDTPVLARLSPPQQKIVPWGKTYAAYRYKPEIVFLGSSRTEIGLPTDADELFSGRRAFNLAISGATLGDAIKMLRHTSYFHRPDVVVWGFDYGWQFGTQGGNSDLVDELIAQEPWYPLKRALINIKRSISMTLSIEAWKILLGLSDQKCLPILATHGHKSDRCLTYIMADEGGAGKAFDKIVNEGDPSSLPDTIPEAMGALDAVTRDYCQQGVAFRFFLHPVHALAELSYWENIWKDQEEWKRGLVRLFDQRRQEGCDIRFMDFTGYNPVTMEDIPQVTGSDTMRYYWEYSHYNSVAGRKILERFFLPSQPGGGDEFGVELTGGNIERHLASFRDQRLAYCASHPQETHNMVLCQGDKHE